jgi:hypothetical protein
MLDSPTIQILQEHIRRTGRSFLNYVHESFPWVRGNSDRLLLDQVATMVGAEREAATAVARFLGKNRSSPPYLGAHPMNFTSYNFLEADRLLPILIEHQNVDVVDLDRDLAKVKHSEAYAVLHHLLDVKKHHRASLKELQEKLTAGAASVQ